MEGEAFLLDAIQILWIIPPENVFRKHEVVESIISSAVPHPFSLGIRHVPEVGDCEPRGMVDTFDRE